MSKEIQVAGEIRRVTGVGGEREIEYDNKDLYKACTSLIIFSIVKFTCLKSNFVFICSYLV
jgi:hypothetical protein